MTPHKYFIGWFMIGVGITSALVLLHQGIGEAVQHSRSVWTLRPHALLMTVLGSGLLVGCLAVIYECAADHGWRPHGRWS